MTLRRKKKKKHAWRWWNYVRLQHRCRCNFVPPSFRIGNPDFKGNRCVFRIEVSSVLIFLAFAIRVICRYLLRKWKLHTHVARYRRVHIYIYKKRKKKYENTRRTKGSRLIWKIKKELSPTDSPNYWISRRNIVGENCKRGRCISWHDASSAIILTFFDDISTEYF